MRLYRWLRKRIKDEKQSILLVVVILYIIMLYDFYTANLVDKLIRYLVILSKAPFSAGQAGYIVMVGLAIIFFLWSTGIVIMSAVELVQRVKNKKGR